MLKEVQCKCCNGKGVIRKEIREGIPVLTNTAVSFPVYNASSEGVDTDILEEQAKMFAEFIYYSSPSRFFTTLQNTLNKLNRV